MPINTQTLVRELNDLNQLTPAQQNLQTSLKKVDIFHQLAQLANKRNEQDYFLMQAISLLEALSLSALENDDDEQTPNLDIDQKTYTNMQINLANCYVMLADVKQQDSFLNVSKKLLKPISKQDNVDALMSLINVCALKNEPALCQFYIKKTLKLDADKKHSINKLPSLQSFEKEAWFTELFG